jgi:hypothetical protein
MCNQTVSLVAAELERCGIATVAIQLLCWVAEKVRPPRALCVPFRHGYPLDTPKDPERQHAVLQAALDMLENQNLKPPAILLTISRNDSFFKNSVRFRSYLTLSQKVDFASSSYMNSGRIEYWVLIPFN